MQQTRHVAGVLGVLVASVGGAAGAVIAASGGARASQRPARAALPVPENAISRFHVARPAADAVRARIAAPLVFVGGRREARLDLRVRDSVPVGLAVSLVRMRDRAVLRRWHLGAVAPGSVRSVVWRGRRDGSAPRTGRYRFRVLADAGVSNAATKLAERTFEFYDHKFPVRGPHRFGGYASTFGGGRGHQGQDVFASCGTSVQAARGGRVKLNAFHARAGNYVVIDGAATNVDYAYMHLAGRSPLAVGGVVHTGQELGHVGQTGRADGCHLHFEMWNGPWQTGGAPFDPLPFIAGWDGYS